MSSRASSRGRPRSRTSALLAAMPLPWRFPWRRRNRPDTTSFSPIAEPQGPGSEKRTYLCRSLSTGAVVSLFPEGTVQATACTRNRTSSPAVLAANARAQPPAAAWPSRTGRRDGDPLTEQDGSNRSLSFAGRAQRLQVPTSMGRAGTGRRGGAALQPSSRASIRGRSENTP